MDAGRILLGTPRLPRWCAARMFQLRAPTAATCAGTRAPHLAMSRQLADKNVSPRSACAPRRWARTRTQGTLTKPERARLLEGRSRGCLLQTDPQERAKTTTASSDCRPRPTVADPGFDDEWALMGKRQQRPKPSVQDTMGVQASSPLYY